MAEAEAAGTAPRVPLLQVVGTSHAAITLLSSHVLLAETLSVIWVTDSWHRASDVTATLGALREAVEAEGALVAATSHHLRLTVALTCNAITSQVDVND